MKVAVYWSGGKECCLAYHKAIKQGHDVACLLTFKYMDPYNFHSFPIMELQAKTLRTPQIKAEIKNSKDPMPEMTNALARLKKEEGIEGFVTGDIAGAGCARVHQIYYELMCDELGMKLVMPLQDPSGDTYDVLKEEILGEGLRPILNCVNMAYFGEEWLGREINEISINDLKALADKQKIDVCSEDGIGYHSMVMDAPFFGDAIKIDKFTKGIYKDRRNRSWLYIDSKEVSLRPKK
jgi:uncharacterized protein (TIGR00290 family)